MPPTRRGPLTSALSRGAFVTLRALARALDRRAVMSPAGPLAMMAVFAGWVVLFWVGYALVYLPNLTDLAFRSNAMRFMPSHGPEALDRSLDPEAACRRLEHLVKAAGSDGDPSVIDDEDEVRRFARFVERCDEFLEHIAGQHLRYRRPLSMV